MRRFAQLRMQKNVSQEKQCREYAHHSNLRSRYFLYRLLRGGVAHFAGAIPDWFFKKKRVRQAAQADPKSGFKEEEQEAYEANNTGNRAVGVFYQEKVKHGGR